MPEVIYMLSLSLPLPGCPERPYFSVSLAVKMRPKNGVVEWSKTLPVLAP